MTSFSIMIRDSKVCRASGGFCVNLNMSVEFVKLIFVKRRCKHPYNINSLKFIIMIVSNSFLTKNKH